MFIGGLQALGGYARLPRTVWTLAVGGVSLVIILTPFLSMWTVRALLLLLAGIVLLNTRAPRRHLNALRPLRAAAGS